MAQVSIEAIVDGVSPPAHIALVLLENPALPYTAPLPDKVPKSTALPVVLICIY